MGEAAERSNSPDHGERRCMMPTPGPPRQGGQPRPGGQPQPGGQPRSGGGARQATGQGAQRAETPRVLPAIGPFGARIAIEVKDGKGRLGKLEPQLAPAQDANGALILRKSAFGDPTQDPTKETKDAVLGWAHDTGLGQAGARELRQGAAARRELALARLNSGMTRGGVKRVAIAVEIRPEWRIAVGLGDQGATEIGITLHGTYGWPVIPGSSLKGIVRHWALDRITYQDFKGYGIDPFTRHDVIGLLGAAKRAKGDERGDQEGDRGSDDDVEMVGSVTFIDAIPGAGADVAVVIDVVTPHHGEYYRRHATETARERGGPTEPPAGVRNPVPAGFLTIGGGGGPLFAGLVGPKADVARVAEWLAKAVDDGGIGGKTAAGYGYAAVTAREQS